ncbi:MAG: M36 family metallopeptidase [Leadbetterella sp.]
MLKKLLQIFTTLVSVNSLLFAQNSNFSTKNTLNQNPSKYGITSDMISQMVVSDEYTSPSTGWHHIYYQQKFKELEVYNAILNITLKQNQIINLTHTFAKTETPNSILTNNVLLIGHAAAVQKLVAYLNPTYVFSTSLKETSKSKVSNGIENYASFEDSNLANGKIESKLVWKPSYNSNSLILAYKIDYKTKNNENVWTGFIDANKGFVLDHFDQIVRCSFGHNHAKDLKNKKCDFEVSGKANNNPIPLSRAYNIFPIGTESPIHGPRQIVANPYTRYAPIGTGPGNTNGWHYDSTTFYNDTRGNNVLAQEDADNNNTGGARPVSDSLLFNYTYSQTLNSSATNRNASITNLFFWNNVIHDVLYRYGFDEPSGNFQKHNMRRGGLGNDPVNADAQDGSGTNNANFQTPADGSAPRMQMFLWSAGSAYEPDSDFDNAIISHEYGHGWSIRLTGGPSNVSCLQNTEQGGEGWSDYLGLMLTARWDTLRPTLANANIPKGIGTYVLNQPTSGAGIRPYKYSYNKALDNNIVTYGAVANSSFSAPHGIGSIWCTMLWDMTWEMIFQDNYIVPNIHQANDLRGNAAALKLVNEGLRLQNCSPSFVDARNAIMKADTLLFNARYSCAIGRAFARRGLGRFASTGSSSNDRIVTEDFTPYDNIYVTSPISNEICNNGVFNYQITTNTPTTLLKWKRPLIPGIANPADSSNSSSINETLINTTSREIIVSYTIEYSPSSCQNLGRATVNVKVKPSYPSTLSNYELCRGISNPSFTGFQGSLVYSNALNTTIPNTQSYIRSSGNKSTTFSTASTGTYYYRAITFTANQTALHTFLTTAARISTSGNSGSGNDTYLTLYNGSFSPTSPSTNFMMTDDDSGEGLLSCVSGNLIAGNTYTLVVSTYYVSEYGDVSISSNIPVFNAATPNWYLTATGRTSIFTGLTYNPLTHPSSGVTVNSPAGVYKFYFGENTTTTCRTLVTLKISNSIESGNLSRSATVCSGANFTLRISNSTRNIQEWQSSVDSVFTSPAILTGTDTVLILANIQNTRFYRAKFVTQPTECNSTTNVVKISTNNLVPGNFNRLDSVFCHTTIPIFTLQNTSANVDNWEVSSDNFSTFSIINNTTRNIPVANSIGQRKYRARLSLAGCNPIYSPIKPIYLDSSSIGGDLGPNVSLCQGTIRTIRLTGFKGAIQNWQSSTDNFSTVTTIQNTSDSLVRTFPIVENLVYRVLVKSGICPSALSTVKNIQVSQGPQGGDLTPSFTFPICKNFRYQQMNLNLQSGSLLKWERINSNSGAITTFAEDVTSINTYPSLNGDKIRVKVENQGCPPAYSDTISMVVLPGTESGTLSGNDSLGCTGANMGVKLKNYEGQVIQWQFSVLPFTEPNQIGTIFSNDDSITVNDLQYNRYVRSLVKYGDCAAEYSRPIFLQLTSNPIGGTLGPDFSVCKTNSGVSIELSGNSGPIVSWEKSMDLGSTWSSLAPTSNNSFPIGIIGSTTKYRAKVNNQGCQPVYSSIVTANPDSLSQGGILGIDKVYCDSLKLDTLIVSSYFGNVVRWEKSITNFLSSTSISSTSYSLPVSNFGTSTQYRAVIKNGQCPEVYSQITQRMSVRPLLNLANQTVSNTISNRALNGITSVQKIVPAGNIGYEAGNRILLNPGFEANQGVVFKAEIKTCVD